MANAKANKQLHLKLVRTSYLYVFEPYKGDDDSKGSYCSHLLFAPTHAQAPEVNAAIVEVGQQFWKDEWPQVLEELRGKDRLCLHRGEVGKPGQAAYKGMLYLSSNNRNRPTVVDGNRNPLSAKDGIVYSGCWVNAIVSIWAQQSPKWGKRINCELNGIQFARDDERLSGGGRAAAAEEFGVAGADADAPPPAAMAGLV